MTEFDVIIIGAGAAGMMCAIEAGKRGRRVLVLDHANKPGKKILMSGGGRCNFTNIHTHPDNFISHNPHFLKSALARYTPQDFIALIKKHDIAFHEKTLGQLFCDGKSKQIVEMLLAEMQQAQVNLQLNTSIEQITSPENNVFRLNTSQGVFQCAALVIATGGLSIPTMGASPLGYRVAEQFDIQIWPTRAGLVPFTWQTQDKQKYAELTGIGVPSIAKNNQISFKESILFTHRGVSGPAILQLSSYWQNNEAVEINLLPERDLFELLKTQAENSPKQNLKTYLSEYLPKRLIETFITETLATTSLAELSHKQLKQISTTLQNWQLKPNGTEGYRTAEVTLGGVDCDALSSKTMAVKHVPGLYFIGEVIDVTGWLGGYNFQWAWASAVACGQQI